MRNKRRIRYEGLIFFITGLIMFQGCVYSRHNLKQTKIEPLTCDQVLELGLDRASDTALKHALDDARAQDNLLCWEQLIVRALEKHRVIDFSHLKYAVHHFNKNNSEEVFSRVVHAYFTGLILGKKMYNRADRDLMKAYIGFEIKRAKTKRDNRLNRAREICQRLDSRLYEKYFM